MTVRLMKPIAPARTHRRDRKIDQRRHAEHGICAEKPADENKEPHESGGDARALEIAAQEQRRDPGGKQHRNRHCDVFDELAVVVDRHREERCREHKIGQRAAFLVAHSERNQNEAAPIALEKERKYRLRAGPEPLQRNPENARSGGCQLFHSPVRSIAT
ncbi:MAG: hypothetical protein IPK23_09805 [Rhizobiales bacterium]|nr:hypothetical protein [Hyphomicrobiales bacterium]